MNVDIGWIKQRPHFVADELSKVYDMKLYYPVFYSRNTLNAVNQDGKYTTKRIFRVPNRVPIKSLHYFIDKINALRIQRDIKFDKPDILYFTDPAQIDYAPLDFSGLIIYDCMDDLVALAPNNLVKERVLLKEREIINKANIVLVTSIELMKVITKRYEAECANKLYLSRNAYGGMIEDVSLESTSHKQEYKLCYFGTISSWFDFDIINESLEKFENIRYLLIGPVVDGVIIPKNDRIQYIGPVSHKDLYSLVQDVDCFIMPFILNDIIKSVDPVKLYEYINYGKNILTIYYEEIHRFEPFVYFYNDIESFNTALGMALENGIKYNYEERERFLNDNNWQARCKEITKLMESRRANNL